MRSRSASANPGSVGALGVLKRTLQARRSLRLLCACMLAEPCICVPACLRSLQVVLPIFCMRCKAPLLPRCSVMAGAACLDLIREQALVSPCAAWLAGKAGAGVLLNEHLMFCTKRCTGAAEARIGAEGLADNLGRACAEAHVALHLL